MEVSICPNYDWDLPLAEAVPDRRVQRQMLRGTYDDCD